MCKDGTCPPPPADSGASRDSLLPPIIGLPVSL
jgi:hypothetical protein